MQFFHTRDPIENLRVRVVARKLAHGSAAHSIPVGTTWAHTFGWQEKQGPSPSRHIKGLSKHTVESPRVADSNGRDHHGISLVSYVDAESAAFSHSQISPTPIQFPQDAIAARDRREDAFRDMHIVLRIARSDDQHVEPEELLLMSLRYYPVTGRLSTSRGFSTVTAAPTGDEDHAILSTCQFTSESTGERFEVALDNENDLAPLASLDDQRVLRDLQRQELHEDLERTEQWKHKHGDTVTPAQAHASIVQQQQQQAIEEHHSVVLLELVSVRGLVSSDPVQIYVELVFDQRQQRPWILDRGQRRSTSRRSVPAIGLDNDTYLAYGDHFQYHFRYPIDSKHGEVVPDSGDGTLPSLRLTAVAVDSWDRRRILGCADVSLPQSLGFIDTESTMWRPVLSVHQQLEEQFLGSEIAPAVMAECAFAESDAEPIVSRFGNQTVSTRGRIRVRIHRIDKSPRRESAPASRTLPAVTSKTRDAAKPVATVSRTVEEILQSVKQHKRYSDATNLASTPANASSSTVMGLLARVRQEGSGGTSPSAV